MAKTKILINAIILLIVGFLIVYKIPVKANTVTATGSLSKQEVGYWWVNSIKEGDLVLLNIQTKTFPWSWESSLYYSDTTLIKSTTHWDTHIYEFIANKSDNYRLRLYADFDFNYTIHVSTIPINKTVPGPPQHLQTTAGDNQVLLYWSPPISDGGSPITEYRIYKGTTPGGESHLISIRKIQTYVDNSVTNGITYYFQISAVNDIGEGERSNEAFATPRVITVQINFSQTGIHPDASEIVLVVDNANYSISSMPISFTWPLRSSHTFTWSDTVFAGIDKRYVWQSTSGLSILRSRSIITTSNGTVTSEYKTQYLTTWSQDGLNPNITDIILEIDGKEYSPSQLPLSFWCDDGQQIQISINTPKGYIFKGWKNYGYLNPLIISISGSISESVRFDFEEKYFLLNEINTKENNGIAVFIFCLSVIFTAIMTQIKYIDQVRILISIMIWVSILAYLMISFLYWTTTATLSGIPKSINLLGLPVVIDFYILLTFIIIGTVIMIMIIAIVIYKQHRTAVTHLSKAVSL